MRCFMHMVSEICMGCQLIKIACRRYAIMGATIKYCNKNDTVVCKCNALFCASMLFLKNNL